MTKPAVLKVDPLTAEAKDPWGGTRRGTPRDDETTARTSASRGTRRSETGGALVGDEVTIEL